MDSLSEINNDMRFEHFIDESLDVDMSACGPVVSSSNVVSYYDEILNTACAPASAVVVRPAAIAHSQLSPQHRIQMQQQQQTHEFLVRLSPVAGGAAQPPRRFSPAAGERQRSPPQSMMGMPLPRIAVRLFGHEQQPQTQFQSNSNSSGKQVIERRDALFEPRTVISQTVTTGSGGGNGCRSINMASLLPPGVTIKTECIDEQPAESSPATDAGLLEPSSNQHAFAIPIPGGPRPVMATTVAAGRVKLEPGVAAKTVQMATEDGTKLATPVSGVVATAAVPKKAAPIEFYCQQCDKSFKSHAEFEKHCRSVHLAAPSYVCQQCPAKQFGNLQSYRTHVKRHVERHPCAICTRTFASAEKLAEHGGTHTSELRLQCGQCQQQFDAFTDYCQHVRIHRRPPAAKPLKWKCPDCGKLFKNRTGITNHAKVHRKNGDAHQASVAIIKTEPIAKTVSPITSTAFTATASATSTIISSATAAPTGSQHLAATIDQVASASAAAASCVPETPVAGLSSGPTSTAAANRPTTVAQSQPTPAAAAVAAVTAAPAASNSAPAPPPPHTCDVCHKSFPGRTQLLRHRDHHNERSFKCLTCSKFYKTERDLKVHSLVHYEQRPHACTHCGKSFLSSSKLKQHSNVHTGERPFKCKYCDKTFTNFPNWLKHVRRSHKVDHKTGEQLEQLPNFLVREKKGSAAGGAGSARAKKEKATAAAAAAAAAETAAAAANGEAAPAAASIPAAAAAAKPRATAARKPKAQQQTAKGQPPQAQLRPPITITIKEEQKEFIVPADSALDLHDTNAVAPQSALTPLTPTTIAAAATANAAAAATAASASASSVYQDEASLPLDLRDMSASIQLQQSIDVHDMQQMQMLITSHDESFASIEDVPLTQFTTTASRKQSPIAGGAQQQQQTGSFAKFGLRMPQMSPIKQELPASRTHMLGFGNSTSSSTPIKAEPGRFSFVRSADGSLPVGFAAVTGASDFVGATDGTAQTPAMVPSAQNGGSTTVAASANATKSKQQQQLSPLSAAANVQRRHFGGVATSHHMFATNVL